MGEITNVYITYPVYSLKVTNSGANSRLISSTYSVRSFKDLNIQNNETIGFIYHNKSNMIQIFIKNEFNNHLHCLEILNNMTIKQIKNIIFDREGIQPNQQRLFFGNKYLVDEYRLSDYNITKESTIRLSGRLLSCENVCKTCY